MTRDRRPGGSFLACVALVTLIRFTPAVAQSAAPSGIQQFNELAPSDVLIGPIVVQSQVVHRALDGSWLKLKAESHWGSFSFLVTRISAEATRTRVRPDFPESPTGFVRSSETEWGKIQCGGPGSSLWLEGAIIQTESGGQELEGRFNFKNEVVRLKLKLVENNPIGADPLPSRRNIYYGTNFRQKLDLYRAESSQPTPVAIFIHGGAWERGDKSTLIGHRRLVAAGISVVAIDYRYIPKDNPNGIVPAVAIPLEDAARAIQFLRSRATEWGLDPARVGVWGISAGAFSSLWLATHPDMKDPTSSDPVRRQSTRPLCAAGIFPQTSLDPVQMQAWVGPELAYGPHAFAIKPAGGHSAFDRFIASREILVPWIQEYSPAALVSPEAPPLFLDYLDFDLQPNEPLGAYYTHSPKFGIGFQQRARDVGARCFLRYAGHEDERYPGWEQFLIDQLTR